MPLYNSNLLGIYLWKNTEDYATLIQLAKQYNIDKLYLSFKSKARQREYITQRILLKETVGKDAEIIKHKSGKPAISNSPLHISFTHNESITGMFLSEKNCGIDIQLPTKRILGIKHKFINEKDFCKTTNDYQTLSLIWSCKEAVFKKYGEHPIFIKEHISIVKQVDNSTFQAEVNIGKKQLTTIVKTSILEGNYLTYTQ